MTDFRALCQELMDEAIYLGSLPYEQDPDSDLIARASTALAQPEPQGPTAWMYQSEPDFDGERWRENWKVTLDEKLARYKSDNKEPVPLWDRPAIEPVPVSERLPGPEDCDAEGRCWFCTPSSYVMNANWVYRKAEQRRSWDTHWLPHWALPVPGVEGADA
jgi:hypothetical protein